MAEIEGEWKVAHLKPRQEKALARDLIQAGIGYCCPFYTKVVRRRDNNKPRKTVLPVFAGYLAFAEAGECSRTVMRTDRVIRILSVKDQRRLIEELDWVLRAVSEGRAIRPLQEGQFAKGQRVKVTQGPLMGYVGEIVDYDGKKHVVLSVEMFRQSIAAQVDASVLKVVEE